MKPIQTQSINDQFYNYIKNEILEGSLKPGNQIDIESLVREFGISRSPIKTAIDKLVGEGFLVIRPRKGTFVTHIEPKELLEYLEIRFLIESYILEKSFKRYGSVIDKLKSTNSAALKAAKKGDYKEFMEQDRGFHRLIILQSKNRKLIAMYDQMHVYTSITLSLYRRPDRTERMFGGVNEHLQIITAIESGNVRKAVSEIKKHASIVIASFEKSMLTGEANTSSKDFL